jgi:peptidoglycan/LPS O-acetylase OafA/YrhL
MGIIRLLLALAVLMEHCSFAFGTPALFSLTGGEVSVESFYIISGFYMSFILNEKYTGINNSYKLFLTNRLLRLYPIYLTVLLLTASVSLFYCFYTNFERLGHFALFAEYYDQMNFPGFLYLIFTNIFIIGQDLLMFLGLNTETGAFYFTQNFKETNPMLCQFLLLPQAWTIGIEILFYTIAPFLLKRNYKIILLLLASSITLRLILQNNGLNFDPWTYRFFPSELAFFLTGNIAYRIYKRIEGIQIKNIYLFIITTFTILFVCFFPQYNLFFNESFSLKSLIYFIVFSISLPFIFKYTRDLKYDSIIGNLSYPIYLVHMLVLIFVTKMPLHDPITNALLAIGFAIGFSILLNKFIGAPIEKYRQNRIA